MVFEDNRGCAGFDAEKRARSGGDRAARASGAAAAARRGAARLDGVAPEDSAQERLQKASLTLANALIATMAIAWVATYWSLGLWRSGAIPFAYQLATVVTLVAFARTRRFAPYRTAQLSMMLVLPFLLQASLGGFEPSSLSCSGPSPRRSVR